MTPDNRATATVTINGTNTDNAAGVALANANNAGVHAVKYSWDGVRVR